MEENDNIHFGHLTKPKKTNIWTRLSSLKKKITIIIGITTALGGIGKFSYEAFTRVSDIQSTIEDLVELKHEHTKTLKLVNFQKLRIDSLKNHQEIQDFNLQTSIAISKVVLKDIYIGEIRFKIAPDKSMYFIEEGNIYPAILDKDSGKYYYTNGKNSFWCN